MEQNLTVLQAGKTVLEKIIEGVNSLTSQIPGIKAEIESLRSMISLVDDRILTPEQFLEANGFDVDTARAQLLEREVQLLEIYAGIRAQVEQVAKQYNIDLSVIPISRIDSLIARIKSFQEGISSGFASAGDATENLKSFISGIDAELAEIEGSMDISSVVTSLSTTLTQLNVGIESIKSAQDQINSGKLQLNEASVMLNKNQILGELQLAQAESQMMLGEAGLTQAKDSIDKAKEDAKKGADLNNILSLDTVNGILIAQNFDMPAGYAGDYLIRVGEDVDSLEELRDMVLIDLGMDEVEEIRLSDIADVEMVDDSDSVYAKVNGGNALLLTFEKQTGYSTGEVTDNILDRFKLLERNLDKEVKFSVLMDQGVYIDMIVKSIAQNMLVGAGLAIIILIIFLRDIKPTIIIACAIPLSVIFAVVLMYFTGITLNIISMSGLTLGIGMLVDNSIVVIENIYRLLRLLQLCAYFFL